MEKIDDESLKKQIFTAVKNTILNRSDVKKRDKKRNNTLAELEAKNKGSPMKVDVFNETNISLPSEVKKNFKYGI